MEETMEIGMETLYICNSSVHNKETGPFSFLHCHTVIDSVHPESGEV